MARPRMGHAISTGGVRAPVLAVGASITTGGASLTTVAASAGGFVELEPEPDPEAEPDPVAEAEPEPNPEPEPAACASVFEPHPISATTTANVLICSHVTLHLATCEHVHGVASARSAMMRRCQVKTVLVRSSRPWSRALNPIGW